MAATASKTLEIQLLGAFTVTLDGAPIVDEAWKTRKVRGLVKLLALAPGHRLHRDQLIEALWPESDLNRGVNTFHQALYNARRVFDHANERVGMGRIKPIPILELKDSFLTLAPGWNVLVDVEQFESAAAIATRAPQNPAVYQSALGWYRGDLLPDDLYEDWAAEHREALRQRCCRLLHELAGLYEYRQETLHAIETLQRLLSMEPTNEEGHVQLMRLYAHRGQRGLALRQFETLREALFELDSEPGQSTRRLYEEIQSGQMVEKVSTSKQTNSPLFPVPSQAPQRKLHNLPHRMSTFIGREKEIGQVLTMLRETRLLTITGAGGVGKTSLVEQAAVYLSAAVHESSAFSDGIWIVGLASLDDPLMVSPTCAQILEISVVAGQPAQAALAQFLEHKHLLLILDNCEHLVEACARLADALLKSCPALSILTTSREPLRLPGEKLYSLPPLPVPEPAAAASLEQLSQIDSLRLFVDRARLVAPGFQLTKENAATLTLICRRLDGIPLALELAAARTQLLAVEQVAARLDHAFQILSGGTRSALPRHQTLRISMDWSYQLLSQAEKTFFARLAVFAGGWTLEAAEEICDDLPVGSFINAPAAGTVLDLLAQMVEKSLVTVVSPENKPHSAGERRYMFLDTVRQYANELLFAQGQPAVHAARDRHLAYYSRLTARAAAHYRGPEETAWMDRLERDLPNLYAALEWSLEGKDSQAIELGMQIAADFFVFWSSRLNHQDRFIWPERLLAAEAAGRASVSLLEGNFPTNRLLQRARVLRYLWNVDLSEGFHWEKLLDQLAESEALLRKLGPPARLELGITLLDRWKCQKNKEAAVKEEFLRIFQDENAQIYIADYLWSTASDCIGRGDYSQAFDFLNQSLPIYQRLGDWIYISYLSLGLARVFLYQGDYQRARQWVKDAISISRQLRNRREEAANWLILLEIARAEGSYAEGNDYAEIALSISRVDNHKDTILTALWMLGENVWSMGDLDWAKRCGSEILVLGHEIRFYREIGHYLHGRIALTEGRLADAEAQLRESLRLMGDDFWLTQKANHLMGSVVLFMKMGRLAQAVRIAGAIDALVRASYNELTPYERFEYDSALASLHASLPKDEFAPAWTAGQEMSIEQAQAFALE